MYKFLFLSLFLLLEGCVVQQQKNNFGDLLYTHPPQYVLEKLQKKEPKQRDIAQFHLNMGGLQLITGDFKGAIDSLTLAKREMALLEASSISENLAAGTISEIFRRYSGYPTDRVMVHNMLVLSYLFSDDIEGARVEVLQADIAMKKLAGQNVKNRLNGQLATSHLLAAMIYELLDETSNALISYRYAAKIMEQRGNRLPLGLKQALLRMSFKLGATTQYLAYRQLFPELPTPSEANKMQTFVVYFDGVISQKRQNSIVLPDHHNNQLMRISVPAYPQYKQPLGCVNIIHKNNLISTQLIDDLELAVRDDLDKEYPSILLLTTTRAIAKHALVKKADKEDPLFGVLVNIATLLTEEADLRSWNVLPSNIQFAYIESAENELVIERCHLSSQKRVINKGAKNVFLINSLSNNIFHYQQ